MLPSTGYFKEINCPFYDSGLCERPYCHYRHVKKDSQNTSNECIESGAILQKLVSAAVQKVLQQTEISSTATSQSTTTDNPLDNNKVTSNPPILKATYNPTPISELNKINNSDTENIDENNEQRKRHIPVPYTPRKPSNLIMKRPLQDDVYSKPFIYIPPMPTYTPGSTETTKVDQYMPEGISESNKYLPGVEIEVERYKPTETQSSNKFIYVPSDKSSSKKRILEYKPAKLTKSNETPSVSYQPTPRSLAPCFSSSEDDESPDIKKRKTSTDFNSLDDLGPEFDILDQILDEEKSTIKVESKTRIEQKQIINVINKKTDSEKSSQHNERENNKVVVSKDDNKKSHRQKSQKKEKCRSSSKDEHSKSKYSDKKSNHKSSSRAKDKEKEHKIDNNKDKKHSSSSKSSKKSSKHSVISKDNEKSLKTRSSKDDSKKKTKNGDHKSYKSSKGSKDERKSKVNNSVFDNETNCEDLLDESNDEEVLNISESDEENIELQCKKIFEEYVPTAKPNNLQETVDNLIIENDYIPSKKRISRTVNKNIKVEPKPPLKPDFKVNAARTMAERLAKVREFHAEKKTNLHNPTSIATEQTRSPFCVPNTGMSKIRIAHVPYASTLLNAKKTISPILPAIKSTSEPSTSTTIVQTVKKGVQRTAHIPNDKFIDRPGVLEPLASKIPANIRSTYLNMMIDVCVNIYLSATDAYARAQHEELTTSKKCSTVQIYKNSAILTISRLKKELRECNGVKKSGTDFSSLQKSSQYLLGKTSNTGSWSIENKDKRNFDNSQEFNGAKLYNNIKKWILLEQQLRDNGFPRPHPSGVKGRAIIYEQRKQTPPKGNLRTCCRCKKEFTVNKKGFAVVNEECIYHPNNKYRIRGEARYQCCSQDGSSDGCCIAPSHVFEYVDYENLKGFVQTLQPESQMDDYGVYSLDCEMCYTTHGLDLTRITVINSSCKVVYETLIKPLHPIIDYNTRYSGITEEQMSDVKTSLIEVQATLLSMFNSKTILIGHSLESDFKALKLIHDTVIDTSVLFPHKMGPPYKRALKNLSSEHLKKIIQNSVDGHDSAEDATVCMELLQYKLKEDLKTR